LLGDTLVRQGGDDAGQVALDGIDMELHDRHGDIIMMSCQVRIAIF
jgi:hypothetical protein